MNTNTLSPHTPSPTQPDNNPLLDFADLPRFDAIRPEHVQPAMEYLLQQAQAALEQAVHSDFPANWQQLSLVLDVPIERLGRAWGAVGHLKSVCDTPELRAAYNAMLPAVTEFFTALGTDERLYAKYKAIDSSVLDAAQQQALKNSLRGFVLSGAELQGADKERFAHIQERQAERTQKFSENALDATDHWAYYANEEELAGVPQDVVQAARAAAQADGKDGYKLTLKIPSYLPVMQFAHSSALREKLYRAYNTRASDQAEGDAKKFDNSAVMAEILALRQEEAQLLGYPHFAEVSLVPKMAESTQQVLDFLRDLAGKARPFAEKDVQDLRDFAREQLNLADPQPWDWAYISEKLKEARYAFSEQEVKQYFPAPRVLAGLFQIVENLFEVRITRDTAPTWHDSVEFYRLERNGQLLGRFYLDPSARNGKRGGAWMDDVRGRWLRPDTQTLQTPVAHLVCNFAEGVGGQAAPAHARRRHHPVPRIWSRPAPHAHASERSGRIRHQRRGMGRSGTAQPVHGKLLLGMECTARHDRPCGNGRAPAPRPVRQNAGGQKLPKRHANPAPGGVCPVRHAAAQPKRRACRRHAVAATSAARSGRAARARMDAHPAHLQPHFCRRLCGRLLQLQMGRSTLGRRLRRV